MKVFNPRDRNLPPPLQHLKSSEAINPCDYSLFAFNPQTPHSNQSFPPKGATAKQKLLLSATQVRKITFKLKTIRHGFTLQQQVFLWYTRKL